VYDGCNVNFQHKNIINKFSDFKVTIIKTGIFVSLAAYWGVILVGTFITFN